MADLIDMTNIYDRAAREKAMDDFGVPEHDAKGIMEQERFCYRGTDGEKPMFTKMFLPVYKI